MARKPSATVTGTETGRTATAHLLSGDCPRSRTYEIRLDGKAVGKVVAAGTGRYEIVGSAYCTRANPFLGTLAQVTASVAFSA